MPRWSRTRLADDQRLPAFVCAAVLLAVGAVLATALPRGVQQTAPPTTRSVASATPRTPAPAVSTPSTASAPPPAPAPSPTRDRLAVLAATRRFMRGYLPFLSNRGAASAIAAASPQLRRALAHGVSPRRTQAMRTRRLSLYDVQILAIGPARARVVALVTAEGTFPIQLALSRRAASWEVTRVGR